MGRRISKEFLHPSILEGVNNKIGNLDSLETDAKGNMVQAINELVEKLDNSAEIENGKELIANAVGEPLTAEESFNEMSSDINSLLSTFKTNMMNNGITVESGDKFKALIDKIATMVEEGSGKGIQFAEGLKNIVFNQPPAGSSTYESTTFSLDFTPTIVFVSITDYAITGYTNSETNLQDSLTTVCSALHYNETTEMHHPFHYGSTYETENYYYITINNNSFDFHHKIFYATNLTDFDITYYAIGVGEEDTSLRDSLASILENKGVDVTEEDDMASLITKVDNISGGLDIISATELPTTGKENQICVITDNPTDNYVVTNDYDYSDTTNIILYNGLKNSAPLINIVSGSVAQQYYITKIIQNDKYKLLESYYWSSNQWNSLTKSYVVIVQDGIVQNTDIIGGIKSQTYVMSYDKNTGSLLTPYSTNYSDSYVGATTTKKIDFGKYNTVTITAKVSNGSRYIYVGTATYSDNMAGQSTIYLDNFFTSYLSRNLTSTSYVDLTFDISGYTGEHYIAFGFSKASDGEASSVYIKDIKLS